MMFNLELTKEELSYIKNTLIHSFERPDLIRKIEVLEINDNVVADTVEAEETVAKLEEPAITEADTVEEVVTEDITDTVEEVGE